MKKFFVMLAVLLTAINFSACGTDKPARSDKIKVVATIFPAYDWTREIIGDAENFETTLLLDKGVDLHSYQPTTEDILKISTCDLFIYVGGESDSKIEDALKSAENKNMVVVKLLDALGDKAKDEEHIAGMEDDDDDEAESESDEHVWLSLKNAQILCDAITDALTKVDPPHAQNFRKNDDAYKEKLAALDRKYQATVDNAAVKTLCFGDRFPFRYLVDDYGLKYFAAFAGCSAETEASFKTVSFLAKKVDELNLPCVLTIEGTNHKIAETVAANTTRRNQKILSLDSMQGAVPSGATYLSIMEKNLEVLKAALTEVAE